MEEVL